MHAHRWTRGRRQLKDNRTLAGDEARDEHHLVVRKLQRVVMGQGVVGVDLPKARDPLLVFPVGRAQAENEAPLVFDLSRSRST